jgi:hypothetical protein
MSSSSSERPYQTKLRLQREAINEFVDRDSTGIVTEYLSEISPRSDVLYDFECVRSDLNLTYRYVNDVVYLLLWKGSKNGRKYYHHEFYCYPCSNPDYQARFKEIHSLKDRVEKYVKLKFD